jgi:prepilin-type N-terminal cleavage/methylation domain-containing protein
MKELHNQGFSLLELLLVLMVLGIVAVAAIPDLSSSNPHRLEIAAEEIAGAMRYARSEALRSSEPHGFQLQTTELRIRVVSADTSSYPWTPRYDVEHPGVHDYYDIDLATHPYASVNEISRNAVFHGNCNNPDLVYFDTNGMPWCGDAGGALLEQYEVSLSFGSRSRVVSLHGITGRVTVK